MYTTINGYTKQKMIDVINKEFKGKAVKEGTANCLYLTEDGKKCGVGCFIPEGHIKKENNNEGIECLIFNQPELSQYVPLDLEGMCHLQSKHDGLSDGTVSQQKQQLIDWIMDKVQDAETK